MQHDQFILAEHEVGNGGKASKARARSWLFKLCYVAALSFEALKADRRAQAAGNSSGCLATFGSALEWQHVVNSSCLGVAADYRAAARKMQGT